MKLTNSKTFCKMSIKNRKKYLIHIDRKPTYLIEHFKVTPAAVSRALSNDTKMSSLLERISEHLFELQQENLSKNITNK